MSVRRSVLAGTWYPGDAATLAADVDAFLEAGGRSGGAGPPRPIAIVVPHAGYMWSGPTAGHAYARLPRGGYDRVIVLAVSHRHYFEGASMLDVDAYETPLGAVPLPPRRERERLRRAAGLPSVPGSDDREHSLEIQLPFLQRALGDGWELVPIVVSGRRREEVWGLGDRLRPWFDERTLVVASSDFTHHGADYGYAPFPADDRLQESLARLDDGAADRIAARDPEGLLDYEERTGITMCGIRPVATMLRMLPADAEPVDLAYDTSGRISGDHERSVSYRALEFHHRFPALAISAALEELVLDRARHWVARAAAGQEPDPGEDAPARQPEVDVFVTLRRKDDRSLRGCLGSTGSPRPLLEALASAATGAATRDTRFPPVEPGEVDGLSVHVSVLTPPVPVRPSGIEIGRHGVLLELGEQRSVFLPAVAVEQGWSLDALLAALCRKARLPEGSHEDSDARLSAFETISIEER